jgi:hypothetical protein
MKTPSPRVGAIRYFNPVLFDKWQRNTMNIQVGTRVRVVQPYGCPRNGTMGMCYVDNDETGEFIGLVCVNSLDKTMPVSVVIPTPAISENLVATL